MNRADGTAEFLRLLNATGPHPDPADELNYLNFYRDLIKASDKYLVKSSTR